MRDNWNMEELSDQAWSQMKALLDQEMPVRGRRRKPVFWWFRLAAAAAVLLLAVGGIWWWNRTDHAIPEQASARIEAPASGAAETQEADRRPDLASVPGEQGIAAPSAASPAPVETINATAAAGSVELRNKEGMSQDKPLTQASAASVETDLPSETVTTPTPDQRERAAALTPAGDLITEPAASLPGNSGQTQPQQSAPAPAAGSMPPPLEITKLPPQSIPELLRSPLGLSEIAKAGAHHPKKTLMVPPEIGAGLLAGLSRENAVGGLIDLRSGLYLHQGRKWALLTGIGLRHQRGAFELSFRRSGNADEAMAESPGMDNQTGNDPQQATDFSFSEAVETSDLQLYATYVDVPVLIDWRFASRWRLAAGSRLSWLAIADWRTAAADLGASGGLGFSNQSDPLIYDLSNANRSLSIAQAGSNATPGSISLSDFYLSATAGLSFQLTAAWRLRLEYQHSLTNLLDSNRYQRNDRSLWLSAAVRF